MSDSVTNMNSDHYLLLFFGVSIGGAVLTAIVAAFVAAYSNESSDYVDHGFWCLLAFLWPVTLGTLLFAAVFKGACWIGTYAGQRLRGGAK